jgi:hypothetical protein
MIYPHGGIEAIANDAFMVRGSMKMNAVLRISRNMGIIREGTELTLINPIRLNDEVEKELKALGEVTNILRLGAFHGIDDPYYLDSFKARFWCQPGGTAYTEPSIDVELGAGSVLPFSDGGIFEYRGTEQPECALLLKREGGILFSCDAIQHYGDYSYNNLPARLIMPFIGFPRTTIIGPVWLKLMTGEGQSLESEFHRLLELEFDKLLAAHGTFIDGGAHAAVTQAVNKAFA